MKHITEQSSITQPVPLRYCLREFSIVKCNRASRRFRIKALIFFAILAFIPILANAERINPERDLQYLGAFKVPGVTVQGIQAMAYGQRGLAFNPMGNGGKGSLFITSHSYLHKVAEITLPTLVDASSNHDVSKLNECDILQAFTDITQYPDGNTRIPNMGSQVDLDGLVYLPAKGLQKTAKLYWMWNNYYAQDATYPTMPTLGWCELDFSTPAALGAQGSWRQGDNSIYASQYLFEVPGPWADVNVAGKCLASGRFRVNGITGGNWGPVIIVSAPWNSGNPPASGTTLPTKTLLLYNPYAPTGYNHSLMDNWYGGAWVDYADKKGVIIGGVKGYREATPGVNKGVGNQLEYYDDPSTGDLPLPDSCSQSKGYHSDPYLPAMLFYEPDDFAKVAAGDMKPYEPQPYAQWYPEHVMFHGNRGSSTIIGGIAYDRAGGRLYVAEVGGNDDGNGNIMLPIIHVWQVRDGGGTSDNSAPSTPTDMAFDTNTRTLSWGASTDDNHVFYIIYRKVIPSPSNTGSNQPRPGGYEPVAMAQSNSWVDKWYDSAANPYHNYDTFQPGMPHSYKVLAMDERGNKSPLSIASGDSEKSILPSPTGIRQIDIFK